MKILHLGKYYPPYFGGIEKVNYDLVEGLNKMGCSTDVLCFNHQKADSFEKKDYRIYRASQLFTLKSTPFSYSLFKILRNIHHQYDIIHIHLPNPIGTIALQSISFKGKIVVHWHSDIVKQKVLKVFYAPFQTALLKRADRIIVTSPPYLEGSTDLKKYKNKCEIIPIGIDETELKCDEQFLSSLHETYKDKKIIFSLGRLIYYKGFNYLIEAAKDLPDNYMILIGGTGELYDELWTQIKTNHLESRVKLLGKIPANEIACYFNLCDLYCLPSCEKSEAFGVVQLEAMSFGKPIISTNIPFSGVPWINEHGNTGLVVPPKSSAALSEAIKLILSDQKARENFGLLAHNKFLAEFTAEKMCQRTIQLYESLKGNF